MSAHEFGNKDRYLAMLDHFDVMHETHLSESSRSAFGTLNNIKYALWCNNPHISAGSFDTQAATDLNRFLLLCIEHEVETVILFIDSAGVSLKDPQNGMAGVAQAIKLIHRLNMRPGCKTVSVIGETRGCFGGALLIAGACQYQIAHPCALIGVSGPQVIESITGESRQGHMAIYTAAYRLSTGEVSHLLTDQCLLNQVAILPTRRLDFSFLCSLIDALPGQGACNRSSSGFDNEPISLGDLKETAAGLLHAQAGVLYLKGNAEQPFSFENERNGFSRYLKALAATLRYRVETGLQVDISVTAQGSGATFIAFSMMGSHLRIAPEAQVRALPQVAVDRIVPARTGAQ
ncbi:hypothetical protein GCM10009104_34920 [Marinobacterium maritimum]|uniref:Uncharacterized protein n=1 Tax=Marinobacterium maritimum TaxID=500162 RepID=A0ABP3TH32_9GAMM